MSESATSSLQLSPIVKWAGGKRQLLDTLRRFWPTRYRRYVEPFVGGGIVYLRLRPSKAILADCNQDLIECYRIVRDQLDELMAALDTYVPRVLDREFYYEVRDQDVGKLSPVERAARFIFLNKTCYNGLYRVNQQGKFNVPFGKHVRPPCLYDEGNIRGVSQLLQQAELIIGDFEETALRALEGDFVYLDPPYHRSANSDFTKYSVDGFSEDDHVRLATVFRILHERGCTLLLSNSDTDLVRELYSDFVVLPVMTKRSINSVGEKRRGFPEVVVTNYGQSHLKLDTTHNVGARSICEI